jgi:hypothetical protein
MTGSPQPEIPSSVSTLRNNQRGGTIQVVNAVIFTGFSLDSIFNGVTGYFLDYQKYDFCDNKKYMNRRKNGPMTNRDQCKCLE